MKKATREYLDEICDSIEIMLNEATPSDRWKAGVNLCKFTATFATDKYKEKDLHESMFSPLKILKEASDSLTEMIDKEILNVIGEECKKYAEEKKK